MFITAYNADKQTVKTFSLRDISNDSLLSLSRKRPAT